MENLKKILPNSKVLVIDDSKTFLLYITDILKVIPNLKIHAVLDPRTALIAADEFQPDLILTDFEMPHLNGNQICTLFKNHPKHSLIPIMMLTSNNAEDQLIKAIENGADDFLFKSSKKEVVIIKITGMLRYRKIIEADIKLKQLEAVKGLIATSNHEFNNALFISNGFLNKLKKSNQSNEDELITIEKIIAMNNRMQKVVKSLELMKTIDLTNYDGEVQMLKLEN